MSDRKQIIVNNEGRKPWSECSGDGCEHSSHKKKRLPLKWLRKIGKFLGDMVFKGGHMVKFGGERIKNISQRMFKPRRMR